MMRLKALRLTRYLAAVIMFMTAQASAMNERHKVPVLTAPLARGEIIREDSLVEQEMNKPSYGVNYIIARENLIGLAAKRPLRAGVPLRASDLGEPKLISKGELVTVVFESPGLSLSIRGKALEDGVRAQAVRVMNTQTGRAFEGVVTAPGYVLASPPPGFPQAPLMGMQSLQYSSAAIQPGGN